MKRLTQIVLVGHTKVRLMEGIKRFPTDRLFLVLGDNLDLEGEVRVREVASALEELFKNLMEIKKIYVNKENLMKAALTLLKTIQNQIHDGYMVQINVSGSLRQMAIASYIASLVSDTPIYSVIPKYDPNFQEIGVEEVYSIPSVPIKELSQENIRILRLLESTERIESIEELINELYPHSIQSQINRLRAKTSYHLKELEAQGFIRKQRAGKKMNIEITPLGSMYCLGQSIIGMKRESI